MQKKNHKEGDIVLKYKLENNNKVLAYIDVKSATETYNYPVIRTDCENMSPEKYFNGITHNFYLGIGRYKKSLKNNTNVEFRYSLGITTQMIKKMLANNCEFLNEYQKLADDDGHFVSMRYFADEKDKSFMPVGKRNTLKGVLDVIEQYILDNKDKNIFKIEQ